jgi:hypothetical protein
MLSTRKEKGEIVNKCASICFQTYLIYKALSPMCEKKFQLILTTSAFRFSLDKNEAQRG